MIHFNVLHQIETIANFELIKNLWQTDNGPTLHGHVFDMESGLIDEIVAYSSKGERGS